MAYPKASVFGCAVVGFQSSMVWTVSHIVVYIIAVHVVPAILLTYLLPSLLTDVFANTDMHKCRWINDHSDVIGKQPTDHCVCVCVC